METTPTHFWHRMTHSALGKTLKLERSTMLTLPIWPLLWGFISAEEAQYMYMLPAILFILTLRWFFYNVIDLMPTDDTTMRTHGSTFSAIVSFIITLGLAYYLGGVVLFLCLLWMVTFGIYQIIYSDTWWPHVSHGIFFGVFPVLIGNASAQDMSFAIIWPMIAGFFWVTSIEMMRAGTALDDDKHEHLGVVNDILGKWKISYSSLCFACALAFLVIAGLFAHAEGYYYVGLMITQALMMTSLRKMDTSPEAAAVCFYTYSAYAGLVVSLTFLAL